VNEQERTSGSVPAERFIDGMACWLASRGFFSSGDVDQVRTMSTRDAWRMIRRRLNEAIE